MIITALQQKGNNVLVCFDDGEFITLDYRTVIDNGLHKNDLIDEKQTEKLVFESNFLKAKDSAFRLLGRRHHSTSELKTKLLRKNYPKEIVERVLIDLTDKEFLNDEQFANSYSEERTVKKKVGINKLKAELFKKGIERKIVDHVISGIDSELSYENALILAKKKLEFLKRRDIESKKLKTKIFSFLCSRGFETEIIMKVLNELVQDEE